MITSDLVLSESGDIVYIQDCPFEKDIARVEFYLETGYLVLVYNDEDSLMVECEITDDAVKKAISTAPVILLSHIENGRLQDGFEVPLVAIRS